MKFVPGLSPISATMVAWLASKFCKPQKWSKKRAKCSSQSLITDHRSLSVLLNSYFCLLSCALSALNSSFIPVDFAFQLTDDELAALRSQFVISKSPTSQASSRLRSRIVTSKTGRGGRRYLPYAFTEQGVAMLSSVLRSARAVEVNIAIMRTFVQLRRL